MIKKFFQDETGLELSEYAVAAALVALAVITAFTTLGGNISTKAARQPPVLDISPGQPPSVALMARPATSVASTKAFGMRR